MDIQKRTNSVEMARLWKGSDLDFGFVPTKVRAVPQEI